MRSTYSIKTILSMITSIAFVVMDFLTSDTLITWGGVFFGCCFILLLVEPLIRSDQNHEIQEEFVEFDEKNIRRMIPNQLEETIDWHELHEIVIATNDQGPFFDDVHWLLMNKR